MLERVFQETALFDVIHSHVDYLHFPFARRDPVPQVDTLHGRLDTSDLVPLYREFCELPFVSISNAQREPLPWVNWVATVYHGLPIDLYSYTRTRGKYLAFLGRVSPEKGVDRAIGIARSAGMALKIAAKIDSSDRPYMDRVIKPLLDDSHVEFIGEIREKEKEDFLGNAYALLFPIDWPEPFGLVLIEAMACGTPVIAYGRGSVPELVEEGVTGFIVQNQAEAVKAVERVSSIDREKCRRVFEERFTAARMAKDYLEVYQRLLLTGEAGPTDISRPDSPYR
jgi:glycosyltransferase involved in cell wall biosynthesis